MKGSETKKTTFGGGCFWCLEAVFQRVEGVCSVVSGYAGGETDYPNYESVCSGLTGHAEVVQVVFDLRLTDYQTLLNWFWRCHDPTTLNRQGADVGTQYRSVIFYHDAEQESEAIVSREEWETSGVYPDPIVTEIRELPEFFTAEDYHQDYFRSNPGAGYCQYVILPKISKLGIE